MRKWYLSILMVLAISVIAIPAMVFADAPTAVIVNWTGGGTVTGTTTAGTSAVYNFVTTGNQIAGTFNAMDSNDNPYSYGVDSTNSYINADVSGGSISYTATRTGSYPMYGVAGQVASSFVGVGADGLGEMATGSTNNFAAMVNGTYGLSKTSGGANYQASGTNYLIQSYIGIGPLGSPIDGNYALVQSTGTGTSKVNDMTNQMGGTSLALGQGAGCYTNANAVMTGSGNFLVQGLGTNGIQAALGAYTLSGAGSNLNIVATGNTVNYGSGVTTTGSGLGSTTLSVIANYGSGAAVTDYSLTVQ
jgi:hypothetical protein